MKTFTHMPQDRLGQLLARFPRLRIAVIGDFFLDKYLDVDPALAETSLETAKVAHQVVAVRHSPGAAGTIVSNLSALGAGTMHAVGFSGDDGESYDLRADLARLRCTTQHLHVVPERMTPTYLKPGTAPTPRSPASTRGTIRRTGGPRRRRWRPASSPRSMPCSPSSMR